ncbi:MAG: hypothetical protein WC718_04225 [Phycisphaerales bacterium]|jgi:hypothetical protein
MSGETMWWERILAAVLFVPMCLGTAVLVTTARVLLAAVGPFAVLFMDDPFGRRQEPGA